MNGIMGHVDFSVCLIHLPSFLQGASELQPVSALLPLLLAE